MLLDAEQSRPPLTFIPGIDMTTVCHKISVFEPWIGANKDLGQQPRDYSPN